MSFDSEETIDRALSLTALPHERMDIVEKVARVGGGMSKKSVERILVRVLKQDPNLIVRHEAAFSLGALHSNKLPISTFSVEALCSAALNDPSIVVRHEAAEVLGSIFNPEVRRTLEQLLSDTSVDVVETARISLERHDHAVVGHGDNMGKAR